MNEFQDTFIRLHQPPVCWHWLQWPAPDQKLPAPCAARKRQHRRLQGAACVVSWASMHDMQVRAAGSSLVSPPPFHPTIPDRKPSRPPPPSMRKSDWLTSAVASLCACRGDHGMSNPTGFCPASGSTRMAGSRLSWHRIWITLSIASSLTAVSSSALSC